MTLVQTATSKQLGMPKQQNAEHQFKWNILD